MAIMLRSLKMCPQKCNYQLLITSFIYVSKQLYIKLCAMCHMIPIHQASYNASCNRLKDFMLQASHTRRHANSIHQVSYNLVQYVILWCDISAFPIAIVKHALMFQSCQVRPIPITLFSQPGFPYLCRRHNPFHPVSSQLCTLKLAKQLWTKSITYCALTCVLSGKNTDVQSFSKTH